MVLIYAMVLQGCHIHFLFTDDSVLFPKATMRECSKIANIIRIYERASGQSGNLDKKILGI